MSVLIKGMKMPESCFKCDLYDDENNFCKAQKEYMPFASFGRDYKDANCPMVEVSEPHGRLIDADALEPDADYDDGEFWAYSEAQVCSAPTIVEAEGE